MTAPVLVCTVGGSPAPIVTAIRTARPAYVVFIVTEDCARPEGGVQPGSIRSLEGAAGILAGTEIGGNWESVIVPPDQPDIASAKIADAFRGLADRLPGSPLIADYTGGTKSMSAALLAAALGVRGAKLQVMAGMRPDLIRVADGTEHPFAIVPDFLLIDRQAGLLRDAWKSFGYAEAAEGLARLQRELSVRPEAPPGLVARIADLRLLSEAFAAWDRFDHAGARSTLSGIGSGYGDWLAPWQAVLGSLLSREPTPHRLLDLWRNAERRAERGQYDDAVARCYRLLEWSGQWLLAERHGIDTGNVRWETLGTDELAAAGIAPRPGQKDLGGLVATLRLLAVREPDGPMDRFLKNDVPGKKKRPGLRELRNMLELRNPSILAHGERPLGRAEWERFRGFMTTVFLPSVLHPEIIQAGVDVAPPQLPSQPPAGL